MSNEIATVSVVAETAAEANRWAAELATFVQNANRSVEVERSPTDPTAQDIGSILTITFSSTAGAAIAHGISVWLSKRQTAKLSITKKKVTAENLTSADAVRIAEIFSDQ